MSNELNAGRNRRMLALRVGILSNSQRVHIFKGEAARGIDMINASLG